MLNDRGSRRAVVLPVLIENINGVLRKVMGFFKRLYLCICSRLHYVSLNLELKSK